jgi:branched-subunit amino acid aminotransferase/4-amino-4-deoxychorismate lyase
VTRGVVFQWLAGERRFVAARDGGEPSVADSWLVEDGCAWGLDAHRARFVAGCWERHRLPPEEVEEAFDAAVRLLPRTGRWFPRIECGPAGDRLRLRLRAAPPQPAGPALVWVPGRPDPRTCPRVKGPDLTVLGVLREASRCAGADEALLWDTGGAVLEGAYTGLLWWRDDVLCLPAEDMPVLPSVTAGLVVRLARRRGCRVRRERCRLDELAGLEAWLVSTLWGIRPVSGWLGAAVEAGPAERARSFGEELRAARTRLEE